MKMGARRDGAPPFAVYADGLRVVAGMSLSGALPSAFPAVSLPEAGGCCAGA